MQWFHAKHLSNFQNVHTIHTQSDTDEIKHRYIYIYYSQGIEPGEVWDPQHVWACWWSSVSERTAHAYIDCLK